MKDEKGDFLLDDNGNEISIFDSWKGFTGYFTKFFETRKNFYKDDGTSTAITTRIIDQNLRRFCENILIFEKIKEKVDFPEVENLAKKSLNEVFSLQFYNDCLLQDGIDFYNKVLGGEILKNGEKIRGINELINEYRQNHKGEKLPFLKLLDKQILSESEKEGFIDEIENDEELLEILQRFYKTAEEKTQKLKELFSDFVKNNDEDELLKIYLSKEALNTICHKWANESLLWEKNIAESSKENGVKLSKKKDEGYSFPGFISLGIIKKSLEKIEAEEFWKKRYYEKLSLESGNFWKQFLQIFEFEFSTLFENKILDTKTGKKIKVGYDVFSQELKKVLQNFEITKESKVAIKNFADSALRIYQMAKYFALEKKTDMTQEVKTGYVDISAEEAKKMIDENQDLIVIDVSPNYDRGHLPGAINYYLGDGSLDKAIPELDKEADYLVYCHVDSVAIAGANKLVEAGFMNVYRLEGNYQAWIDAGYPIEK